MTTVKERFRFSIGLVKVIAHSSMDLFITFFESTCSRAVDTCNVDIAMSLIVPLHSSGVSMIDVMILRQACDKRIRSKVWRRKSFLTFLEGRRFSVYKPCVRECL
jgi:hypothetical protein